MRKLVLTGIVSFLILSCSTDGSSSSTSNSGAEYVMTSVIDGSSYDLAPQAGGDSSDSTGGAYGDTFQLLEGFVRVAATSKLPVPEKRINIKLLLPKTDLTLGDHYFQNTAEIGNYFADLDVTISNNSGEDEATVSGKITVSSYDLTTKRIKGSFQFTTNDGVSATQTHTVTGAFNYVLAN